MSRPFYAYMLHSIAVLILVGISRQSLALPFEGKLFFPPWTIWDSNYEISVTQGHGTVKTITDPIFRDEWRPRFELREIDGDAIWIVDCSLLTDNTTLPARRVVCLALPMVAGETPWSFVAAANLKDTFTGRLHDGQSVYHFDTGQKYAHIDREGRGISTSSGDELVTVSGFSFTEDPTRRLTPMEDPLFEYHPSCDTTLNIPCEAVALFMTALHQLRLPYPVNGPSDNPKPISAELPTNPDTFDEPFRSLWRQGTEVAASESTLGTILMRYIAQRETSPPGPGPSLGPDMRFSQIGFIIDVLGLGAGGNLMNVSPANGTLLDRPGTFHYPLELGLEVYDFLRVSALASLSFSNTRSGTGSSKTIIPNYMRFGVGSDLTAYRLNDWRLRLGGDYSFVTMRELDLDGRSIGIRIAADYVTNQLQDRATSLITTECRAGYVTLDAPLETAVESVTTTSPDRYWELGCRVGLRFFAF